MTGAMACSIALLSVASVRRLAWLNTLILADLLWQFAASSGVPAWSTLKINSASDIYSIEALLSPVGVKELVPIVAFMARWQSCGVLGSYRYVESAAGLKWSYLN